MKPLANRLWPLSTVCMALIFCTANARPQEQNKTTSPTAMTGKHHNVPKGQHSKSKTFTDDWDATSSGKTDKGKGVPDHWTGSKGGSGKHSSNNGKSGKGVPDDWTGTQGGAGTNSADNGKGGKGATDNWIATDSRTTTSHKGPSHTSPKPMVHAQPKNPK